MVNPAYDCASCKQPKDELFYDKRYKQSICRSCFLDRRNGARVALDTEWLVANIPFNQMSEAEKDAAGIRDEKEYEQAKAPAVPDGTEDGKSTRELRGKT
jgi:hypothetical protein